MFGLGAIDFSYLKIRRTPNETTKLNTICEDKNGQFKTLHRSS